jgi:hypothetical protein
MKTSMAALIVPAGTMLSAPGTGRDFNAFQFIRRRLN